MIPKIIHYCWFGGKTKPKFILKYLKTWECILNDYEIIEWNENNFDINSNLFTKQAYENKKFAFVSDYVRLHALFNHGGIYLDTDVEVLKSFDGFLSKKAFMGFEGDSHIGTALIAAEKNNDVIGEFFKYYQNKKFILDDGQFDQTPNPQIVSHILSKKGLLLNDTYQVVEKSFEIFPKDFFSAKSYLTGEIIKTSNTVCIHHFEGSWLYFLDKIEQKFCYFMGIKFRHKLGGVSNLLKKIQFSKTKNI